MLENLRASVHRREAMLERVRGVLVAELKARAATDEIDPDTPLFGTGLGLDSIDMVDLIVAIETAFHIKFPETMQGRAAMRTVNGLVDLLLDLQGGADAHG